MDDRAEQNTVIKFHVFVLSGNRLDLNKRQIQTSATRLNFLNNKPNTLLPTSEMKARENDTVLHLDVSPLTLLIIYYKVYIMCYYVTYRPWTLFHFLIFPSLYLYTKRYDGLSRLNDILIMDT